MNPVLLKLLASLKVAMWTVAGCFVTLGVQRYTTSSSSSWDEKAATEKEVSGKGMKFEINQLSKQLEEKEQSLKTWEEMLLKQAADLKEQQAAVSSVSARTTTVTTVAESKPDQPIIDDVPFGEEEQKNKQSKNSKTIQRGIAKQAAAEATPDVPRRPAVFDGSGTPAVALPPPADVVTIKEEGDIPEALQAKLRAKDRALEVLKEQREALNTEKNALEAEAAKLRTLNEGLNHELEKTKQKLAKAEAGAKERALGWEQDASITFACLRGNEWEDPKKQSEHLKDWLSQRGMLPEEGSFAVCRLKPKEASSLWWLLLSWCPLFKWAYNEHLDLCRGALNFEAVRKGEVNVSDFNECYDLVPTSVCACTTNNPKGGMVVTYGKGRYSVRPQSKGWLCWLFCPCKKRTKEIRKLKCKETVIKVTSEENLQDLKMPELSDVLSLEEGNIFEQKKEGIGTNGWTSLEVPEDALKKNGIFFEACESNEDDDGYYTSYVFLPCSWLCDGMNKVLSWFRK